MILCKAMYDRIIDDDDICHLIKCFGVIPVVGF